MELKHRSLSQHQFLIVTQDAGQKPAHRIDACYMAQVFVHHQPVGAIDCNLIDQHRSQCRIALGHETVLDTQADTLLDRIELSNDIATAKNHVGFYDYQRSSGISIW